MRTELCGPSSQVMALGIVPMCSYQMERMFNTTRIPGKETGTQHSRGPSPPSQRWAGWALRPTACPSPSVLCLRVV